MIKMVINKRTEQTKCYQVLGEYNNNGKVLNTKFFVFADDELGAKTTLDEFRSINPVKYNMTTLADAQRAYKKEFCADAEIESPEFAKYIH